MRLWIAAAVLLCASLGFGQTNLVPNPGMEGEPTKTLPDGWDTVMIGNPVEFAVDRQVKHGGDQSLRLTATDSARSYVRTAPIPVAPGEVVKGGAWVKFTDVPEKMGTVILIAEWSGADGKGHEVAKFDVAQRPGAASDWQFVSGSLTVPPGAGNVRMRLGFSYSQGTCWWDDATLSAEAPLAVRIDLPTPRVTPAMAGLPLTVLNRTGAKGPAKVAVRAGKESAVFDVTLDGKPVQAMTVPLPVGTQKGKIAIDVALTPRGAGKPASTAKFEGQVPPPLILPPVTPTHWCVEDGPAQVSGIIDLSVAPVDLDGATMELRVLDGGGTIRASQVWKEADHRLRTGRPTPFELKIPGLDAGDYRIVVDFKGKEQSLSAEQPWGVIPRRLAKVTISSDGFPVYNGKTIWPMGIFNGGRFEEQAKAGFTISHAYNAVRITPGRDPEDQRAKNFLDQSLQHGQKALFMVPLRLAEEGDWEGFRRRVRLFRNHPALLAWDEEEGLARGDWKKETLEKVHAILREEDPHHPFMVGDASDVITKMGDRSNFFPANLMDLGMWWWYPFPMAARGANALEGEEASAGTTLEPPTFLVRRNTDKPIWVGIQAYKKPGATARYPTPTEYRLQAYYAIVTGAQGLMWYGGGVTGGMHTNLKDGHWEDVQKLVRELRDLEWAWLAPTVKKWDQTSGGTPVAGAVKTGPRGTVVVAVNRGAEPVEAALPIGDVDGEATVIGEDRTLRLRDGVRERFDPYAVHVYLLPAR